jgi:hypothetical protein
MASQPGGGDPQQPQNENQAQPQGESQAQPFDIVGMLAQIEQSVKAFTTNQIESRITAFSDWLHESQRRSSESLASRVDDISLVFSGACDAPGGPDEDVSLPVHVANLLDRLRKESPVDYQGLVSGGERALGVQATQRKHVVNEAADEMLARLART